MKKIIFCLMVACLSLTFIPLQLNASNAVPPSSLADPKTSESPEAKALLLRLEEIKAKDMSKLRSPERKELRKEVKSIKQQLKEIGGGIYISAAAAIIILLLLVLLYLL